MINYLIFVTMGLLILSKFFDCVSTSIRIQNIEHERNGFARKIMHKIGIKTTIWLIFVLVVIIVSLVGYKSLEKTFIHKIFVIVLGLLIAGIQFAVAHTNMTGKSNFIVRLLYKFYR